MYIANDSFKNKPFAAICIHRHSTFVIGNDDFGGKQLLKSTKCEYKQEYSLMPKYNF